QHAAGLLELLREQLGRLAERLPVSSEQEVGEQPETGKKDEGEDPRQGRLRSPVLQDQEDRRGEGVEAERPRQDRADVAQSSRPPAPSAPAEAARPTSGMNVMAVV